MSEQAGRLVLDVVGDLSGLRADVQRKAQAAVANLRVQIRAEIDSSDLRRQAVAAARAASRDAKIRFSVEVDSRSLNAQVRAIAEEASRSAKIKLSVDTDSIREAAQQAARDAVVRPTSGSPSPSGGFYSGRRADVPVGADTDEAERKTEAFRQRTRRTKADVPVDADTSDAESKLSGLSSSLLSFGSAGSMFTAIAGGIGSLGQPILNLVGAIEQGAAGLVAMAAAASQAVGILAALPGAFAGVAAIVGTVKAAFTGVGAALKAADQAGAQGAAQAQQQASTRAAAARAVQSAQESLQRAEEQRVETYKQAGYSIAAAERQISDAQRRARDAQDQLNQARNDARRTLEDYRLELSGARLDEESAQLALQRAEQQRTQTLNDPRASALDKQEADLAYREAQQRLAEVQQANSRLKAQATRDLAVGVEGDQRVVQAKQGVADAVQAETDARVNLGRTQETVARQERDADRSVADAQRNLADAQQRQAEATTKATKAASAYDRAMAKLPASAQRFVRFLHDTFMPAWKGVQTAAADALLPSLQTALTRALRLVQPIESVVTNVGRALGAVAINLAEGITTPQWLADIRTIGRDLAPIIEKLGRAFVPFLNVLRDFAVVALRPGGIIDRFADWTTGLAKNAEQATGAARANGDLFRFFQNAGDTLEQWGRIIGNVLEGIKNIGEAAIPAGIALNSSLESATATFAQWTKDNGPAIQQFFSASVPVLREFGNILVDVAKILGRLALDPNNVTLLTRIRTEILPAIDRLLQAFQNSGTSGDVVTIIRNLLDVLTAAVNSGALADFSSTLADISQVLADFAKDPNNTTLIRGLTTLALAAGPLATVGGALVKMGQGVVAIAGGASKALPVIKALLGVTTPSSAAGRAGVAVGRAGIFGAAGYLGGQLVGTGNGDGSAGSIGHSALNGAVQGAGYGAAVGSIVPGVGTAIGAAAGTVIGAVAGTVAGQKGDTFEEKIKNFDQGITDFFTRTGKAAYKWADDFGGKIRDGFYNGLDKVGAGIRGVDQSITDFFSRNLDAVGGWIRKTDQSITDFFVGIGKSIADWTSGAAKTVGDWVGGLASSVGDGAKDLAKRFGDGVSETTGKVIGVFQAMPAAVAGAVRSVRDWFGRRAGEARDTFASNFSQLKDRTVSFFQALPGNIVSAVTSVRDWFGRRAGEWRDGVVGVVQQIGPKIGGFFSGLPGQLNSWFQAVRKTFADRFGELPGMAYSTFQRVLTTISTFMGGIPGVFTKAVDLVTTAWGKLQEAAKAPVRFVVKTVINDGLIAGINKVAGAVGIQGLDPFTLPKGFREGGSTGQLGRNVVAGVVHGNEHVWTAEETERAGGHGVLEALRAAVMRGQGGILGLLEKAVQGYATGGRVWPTNTRTLSQSYPGHSGVDIAASMGAPIYAPEDGEITFAGYGRGYGQALFERFNSGLQAVFGHSSRIIVNAGRVAAGQLIGLVGSTGNSTGPHLHFEVDSPGPFANPANRATSLAYLNGANVSGTSGGGTTTAVNASDNSGFDIFGTLTGLFKGPLDRLKEITGTRFGQVVAAAPRWLAGNLLGKLNPASGLEKVQGFLHNLTGGHLFDNGGVLPHGGAGVNLSGRPEPVLNDTQWTSMSRLAGYAANQLQGGAGQDRIRNYFAEGAIQVKVYNPQGEPTEASINTRMRALADLGLFDGGDAPAPAMAV